MSNAYTTDGPQRTEIDAMAGAVVVQFGTDWCGWCQAAEPLIEAAFADFPGIRRIRIEDGKGRPVGRSFGIRLWPTLVFLMDGREVDRVTRPQSAADVSRALAEMTDTGQSDG